MKSDNMHTKDKNLVLVIVSLIVLLSGHLTSVYPQNGEQARGLKPDVAGIKVNPKRKSSRPLTFRGSKNYGRRPPRGTNYRQIGVTIWRVDSGNSKGIEQVGEEQTIERLDADEPYRIGDTIRLGIESPVDGYLYIIDQERYADDSAGPATLIFPTSKTRRGNNRIWGWKLIEVPAYPSVWRFKARQLREGELRKLQTAEELTIVLSPKPLIARSRISDVPLVLEDDEFESWKRRWKTMVQVFNVEDGAGHLARTKGIEQIGEEASLHDEFGSQAIYLAAVKPRNPLFVTLVLRFDASPSN